MSLPEQQTYDDADCYRAANRPPAAAATGGAVMGVPLYYTFNSQVPMPHTQQPQQGYAASPTALTADEAFLVQQPQQRVPTTVYDASPAQGSVSRPAKSRTGGDIALGVLGAPRRIVGLAVSAPFRALGAAHRAVLPGTEEGHALGERRVAGIDERRARRERRRSGRFQRYERLIGSRTEAPTQQVEEGARAGGQYAEVPGRSRNSHLQERIARFQN